MNSIFLASVTPFVGKNAVAVGLAEKFRREKKSVGYFKPIGPLAVRTETGYADEDASFFKKTFGLDESVDQLCPIVLTEQTIADQLRGAVKDTRERVLAAWETVSKGKDVMIVTGMGRLSSGLSLGYPMVQFVQDVNARVIAVERCVWPAETLDGILHMQSVLPKHFAGVIFNRLPASMVTRIDQGLRPFLQARGVEVFGRIPDDVVLNSVPLSDLVAALDGKVLCGGDKLDQLVEHFSIGAMTAEAALRFFHGVPHKAVIVGGDRSDIQLAALQTSTRALILTGDLYPNERILARAEEAGVPVILVSMETSQTAEICDRLHRRLRLHSERKIARACELMEKGLDWALLRKKIGMA